MGNSRILWLIVVLWAFGPSLLAATPYFQRGDANVDGKQDISDAIVILNFLFQGTSKPTCFDAADTTDDGKLDITDSIFLFSYLFIGGRPPPFPATQYEWGPDPTGDALDCTEYRLGPLPETRLFTVGNIFDLEVLSDGRHVAIGGKGVAILDLEGGLFSSFIPSTGLPVNDIAASPDGRILAVAGPWTQSVTLWDSWNGTLLRALEDDLDPHQPVLCVNFSRDGTRLLSVHDHRVCVWEVATGALLRTISQPGVFPNCAVFSPDGEEILAGGPGHLSNNNNLWLLDVVTGALVKTGIFGSFNGESVEVLSFSPDGRWFAAGGRDDFLELWDFASWEARHTIMTDGPWSIAFSPDSRSIVLACGKHRSGDTSISIYDVETGTLLDSFMEPGGACTVAFSTDGKSIVSGACQGPVRIWDLESGVSRVAREDFMIDFGANFYMSSCVQDAKIAFAPDGRSVAVGVAWDQGFAQDSPIRIWDTATGGLVRTFETAIYAPVSGIERIAGDSRFLSIRSSPDSSVIVWDADTGNPLQRFPGQNVTACAADPVDGNLLVASMDGSLSFWSLRTGSKKWEGRARCLRLFDAWCSGGEAKVLTMGDSPEGPRLEIWNLPPLSRRCVLEGSDQTVTSATFIPPGDRVLLGDSDGRIGIHDARSGMLLSKIDCIPEEDISLALGTSLDGALLCAGASGEIKVYDSLDLQEVATLRTGYQSPTRFTLIQVSADLSTVAASDESYLFSWDVQSGEMEEYHADYPIVFDFTPDCTGFLLGDVYFGNILLLDRGTGEILERLRPLEVGSLSALTYSPDGTRLASGHFSWREWWENMCPDPQVIPPDLYKAVIWDVSTGKPVHVLKQHDQHIIDIAYSQEGDVLATFDSAGTVRLWDAGTGSLVQTLTHSPSGSYGQVAFSADGSRILAGSKLWDDSSSFAVWDRTTYESIGGFLISDGGSVVFSRDGTLAVAGKKIINAFTGEVLGFLPFPWLEPFDFVPQSNLVLGTSIDHMLVLYDRSTGSLHQMLDRWGDAASASPDGSAIAGAVGTAIQFWTLDHSD